MSGINRLVLNKKAVFLKEGGFLFGQKNRVNLERPTRCIEFQARARNRLKLKPILLGSRSSSSGSRSSSHSLLMLLVLLSFGNRGGRSSRSSSSRSSGRSILRHRNTSSNKQHSQHSDDKTLHYTASLKFNNSGTAILNKPTGFIPKY